MNNYLLVTGPAEDVSGGNSGGLVATAELSNGSVVSVMQVTDLTGPDFSEIRMVIHDGDGNAVAGPEVLAHADGAITDFVTREKLGEPQVFELGDGGFLVSWSHQEDSLGPVAQMVQRFTANGTPRGDAVSLYADLDTPPRSARVLAPLPDGGFVAAHAVDDFFTPANDGLYLRVYKSNGTAVDDDFVQYPDLRNFDELLGMAEVDGETLLVLNHVAGLSFAQRLDADGAPAGEPFQIVERPEGLEISRQTDARLVDLGGGRMLSAWHGTFASDDALDIMAKVFNADGTEAGALRRINQNHTGDQLRVEATALKDGGAIVAWYDADGRGDNEAGIYARLVNSNGAPVGAETRISHRDGSGFRDHGIGIAGDGDLIVSYGQLGIFAGGFVQLVTLDGSGDATEGTRKADTINGTRGADLIAGFEGRDNLRGQNGSDTLHGGGGNDVLVGGKGADSAFGGDGDDKIDGSQGNDLLSGEAGRDEVSGGDGADFVRGGLGNDHVNGGNQADNVSGDQGDDVVRGGRGNDRVEGGSGNDRLFGDGGADLILAGSGDDVVRGGGGDDRISLGSGDDVGYGNGGADTFLFNGFANADRIADLNPDEDRIEFATSFISGLKDLTALEILQDYGTRVDGDTILEFDTSVGYPTAFSLQIDGITNWTRLADAFVLV